MVTWFVAQPWDENVEELLRDWANRASSMAQKHEKRAKFFRTLHNCIGVPTIILSVRS